MGGPLAAAFGTTSWSWVLQAARGGEPQAVDAWHRLAVQYWKPLYTFCRCQGDSPSDAQDQVQSFFESLFERDRMTALDPARGRFRNWLMAAIQQHRQMGWRRAQAQKRRPHSGFIPKDVTDIEEALQRSYRVNPEDAFRREWANTILERARETLRQQYASRGLADRFEDFWPRLTRGVDPAEHGDLARRLGLTRESLATALWRFRQDYRAVLRRTLGETMDKDGDLDEELAELIRAVSC